MRRAVRGMLAIAGLVSGCAPNWGGLIGPAPPSETPLITRFEVFTNPQTPNLGPFEILAQASGQGTLTFSWQASGGLLSVATESVPAASASLTPSLAAWLPPRLIGRYQVTVTVTDAGGNSFFRKAEFQVDPNRTRVLSPQPASLLPPGTLVL